MNTEDIKLVAEWLGKPNVVIGKHGQVFYDDVMDKMGASGQVFEPLSPSDSMEILKKLAEVRKLFDIEGDWELQVFTRAVLFKYKSFRFLYTADTLEQAIFNAALVVAKENQK